MERRRPSPSVIRSSLILEVAAELSRREDLPYPQAQLSLGLEGEERARASLRASGTPADLETVARGEADLGIINPSALLTVAVRGGASFGEPLPLRAITVIPSYDQLMLAVAADTGLTSVADIASQRRPLRISMRGQRDHSIHTVVDHVLAAAGLSVQDVRSWGGEVHFHPGLPNPSRLAAVERGEANAIFDEAVRSWGNRAVEMGMRLLPIDEPALDTLESWGYRRSIIGPSRFPALTEEVPSIDFSGWAVFTRTDAPDSLVEAVCAGLEARRDRVCWQGDGPLPLEDMCRDTQAAPLGVPLHSAAQRFWQERGYLG